MTPKLKVIGNFFATPKLRANRWVRSTIVALSIYFFLVSIKLMSSGFKGLGAGFSETLIATVDHPLAGLFVGILATSLVQSSSATTSIAVALVASGALPLHLAIPIIIGANIGTTVTNIIVSFGHVRRGTEFKLAFAGATVHDFFNICTAATLFPIEIVTRAVFGVGLIEWLAGGLAWTLAGGSVSTGGFMFTSPLEYIVKPVEHGLASLLINPIVMIVVALLILFLCLRFITGSVRFLMESRLQVLLDRYLFKSPLASFGTGVGVTAVVQSSSITTSLVVPLVGGGLLSLEQVYPYTLGANVGTTVTAILASLVEAKTAALAAAFAHLFFNLIGIAIFYPLRRVPMKLATYLAERVQKRKRYAIIFVIITFYIIPGIIIWVI